MNYNIRKMKSADKQDVLLMMSEFYQSDAVATNGSTEIFVCDFEHCIKNSPYLEGYIFELKDAIMGYAMIAKSFSTEYGKPCIWFEDLYLKPKFRGRGIVSRFIQQIKQQYTNAIFKLEVEKENRHACYVYEKNGFKQLPYVEMADTNN